MSLGAEIAIFIDPFDTLMTVTSVFVPMTNRSPARRVKEGKTCVCDEFAERMLQRTVGGSPTSTSASPLEMLAYRELEVFRLIGEGIKTTEIAKRLHSSVNTIETCRDRIPHKLDLSDGVKLAHFAARSLLEQQ